MNIKRILVICAVVFACLLSGAAVAFSALIYTNQITNNASLVAKLSQLEAELETLSKNQTDTENSNGNNTQENSGNTDTSSGTQNRILINLNEKINNQSYPAEISGLYDNNLIDINCSEYYSSFAGGAYESVYGIGLDNSRIQNIINAVNTQISPNRIFGMVYCKGSDNKELFSYSYCVDMCGGAIGTKVYTGFVNSNSLVVDNQVTTDNPGAPYWDCRTPIALTKDNKFYILCSGGDGGFGGWYIYRIDLTNKTTTKIFESESTVELP